MCAFTGCCRCPLLEVGWQSTPWSQLSRQVVLSVGVGLDYRSRWRSSAMIGNGILPGAIGVVLRPLPSTVFSGVFLHFALLFWALWSSEAWALGASWKAASFYVDDPGTASPVRGVRPCSYPDGSGWKWALSWFESTIFFSFRKNRSGDF